MPTGAGTSSNEDADAARELAGEDASFADEAERLSRESRWRPITCAICWCHATPMMTGTSS